MNFLSQNLPSLIGKSTIGKRKFYQVSSCLQGSRDQEQEQKRDLRSRGLCLVPQSCASYFINTCSTEI